jgi:hypothetical protein
MKNNDNYPINSLEKKLSELKKLIDKGVSVIATLKR